MLKNFSKPLSCFDVIVIVLILLWFILIFLNKNEVLQILMFLASHILFYLSKMILNEGNFFVPSAIVLLVSFTALITQWFNNGKKTNAFLKDKRVYWFFTIVLAAIFLYGCILAEASSILMPPPH